MGQIFVTPNTGNLRTGLVFDISNFQQILEFNFRDNFFSRLILFYLFFLFSFLANRRQQCLKEGRNSLINSREILIFAKFRFFFF